jgi:hypothetical protein
VAEQGLERACSLDARELMAKAKMSAGTECEMPVRSSLKIEFLVTAANLHPQAYEQ